MINTTLKSNKKRNENDFYETPRNCIIDILRREKIDDNSRILDPACGNCIFGDVIKSMPMIKNPNILNVDIENSNADIVEDFLKPGFLEDQKFDVIITNPPYSKAEEFLEKSWRLLSGNGKVIFLLRTLFLEGLHRYELFKNIHLTRLYVYSNRLDLRNDRSKIISFSWFVFQRNCQDQKIQFINQNEEKYKFD